MTDLSTLPIPPNCPYFTQSPAGDWVGWLFTYPVEADEGGCITRALKPHEPNIECVVDGDDRPIICAVAAEYWDREILETVKRWKTLWRHASRGRRQYYPKDEDLPEFQRTVEYWKSIRNNANLWRNAGRETA